MIRAMFERKTVFVVGAGASCEVGLPAGDKLKDIIASKVDIRFQHGHELVRGDIDIVETCRSLARESNGRADINLLCGAGRSLASAMNQAISIDNYLHAHAEDNLVVTMGKLGIASSILEAEQVSTIYVNASNGDRLDFANVRDSWHNTFAKMLTEGVQRTDIEHIFDNVAIITFNYDRCIEHYLSYWLANYFKLHLSDAQALTLKLQIYHPYGQVGRLPWQNSPGGGISFGEELSRSNSLIAISRQLRTFTERVEDDGTLEKMRNLLRAAEKIIYLGFSFGSMNMELLTTFDDGPSKEVYGTVMGISGPNIKSISNDIRASLKACPITALELASYGANQLLYDYWRPMLA